MIGYIDASVLLSLLLRDRHATVASSWWHQCEDRASSILLAAECRIVLRRAAATQRHPKKWLADKEHLLERALEGMQLRMLDTEIVQLIRSEPRISGCRTLDAIHVATAMHFHEQIGPNHFCLCTFDHRMVTVAKSVGLPLMTPV